MTEPERQTCPVCGRRGSCCADYDRVVEERDQERYIGVPCPICGRMRLIYEPGDRHNIHCEKCGADRDDIYNADPSARAEAAERQVELHLRNLETAESALNRLREALREASEELDAAGFQVAASQAHRAALTEPEGKEWIHQGDSVTFLTEPEEGE